MLKSRIGKLEARTGGKDDLLAFKRLIEAIHEMDPTEIASPRACGGAVEGCQGSFHTP